MTSPVGSRSTKPLTTPNALVIGVGSASGARETANRLGGMRLAPSPRLEASDRLVGAGACSARPLRLVVRLAKTPIRFLFAKPSMRSREPQPSISLYVRWRRQGVNRRYAYE